MNKLRKPCDIFRDKVRDEVWDQIPNEMWWYVYEEMRTNEKDILEILRFEIHQLLVEGDK